MFGGENERREYVRLPLTLRVDYEFYDPQSKTFDEHTYTGESEDISGGGLMLRSPIPGSLVVEKLLKNNQVIGLKIHIPDENRTISLFSRISWFEIDNDEKTLLMGLQFKEVTSKDLDDIFNLIIRKSLF